jgi:hypothetical protein
MPGDTVNFGRLVRASRYPGAPTAVAYIVAVPDSAEAIDVIRRKVGAIDDEIEDLGRVSGALLMALGLLPGEFIRAGDRRRKQPRFMDKTAQSSISA